MSQDKLPKLNLLLGAGSTISAGMPSTLDISTCLESLTAPGQIGKSNGDRFFASLKDFLVKKGEYKDVNFELMLYALETIEPFLHGNRKSVFEKEDYFRSVVAPFVELSNDAKFIEHSQGTRYWRIEAFKQIGKLIGDRLSTSTVKEKHLSDLLLRLNSQFGLKVFTLNYDDLVDRVPIEWRDGFIPNNSNYCESFGASQFLADDQSTSPLLVHLHGSTRFGYMQGSYFEIDKYRTPEIAGNHLLDMATFQNVHGRLVASGPMISGLSKVEQLLLRPKPYGYYFNSFINNLIANPRLLILGYGGYDRHINDWILESIRVHGDSARIAYVGGKGNKALVEQLLIDSRESLAVMERRPHYGKTLVLEPEYFPFSDDQLTEKLASFLES